MTTPPSPKKAHGTRFHSQLSLLSLTRLENPRSMHARTKRSVSVPHAFSTGLAHGRTGAEYAHLPRHFLTRPRLLMQAMQNCCSCETSSSSSSSSSSGTCEVSPPPHLTHAGIVDIVVVTGPSPHSPYDTLQVDKSWTHPSYKDDCDSYISGKSKKYACDSQAKAACCTCQEDAKSGGASGSAMCTDKKAGSDTWHDRSLASARRVIPHRDRPNATTYRSRRRSPQLRREVRLLMVRQQVDPLRPRCRLVLYATRTTTAWRSACVPVVFDLINPGACSAADSETAWGGMTAKEACCTCDGGEYGATCTDSPGW